MTLDDYQQGALRTARYPDAVRVLYPTLKLAGEAGEVAEKLGKLMRDAGSVSYTHLTLPTTPYV